MYYTILYYTLLFLRIVTCCLWSQLWCFLMGSGWKANAFAEFFKRVWKPELPLEAAKASFCIVVQRLRSDTAETNRQPDTHTHTLRSSSPRHSTGNVGPEKLPNTDFNINRCPSISAVEWCCTEVLMVQFDSEFRFL
jgi:hypothetical protein